MLPTVDVNGGVPEIDVVEAFGAQNGYYGGSNQVHYDLHSGTNPTTAGTWATVNANICGSVQLKKADSTPRTPSFTASSNWLSEWKCVAGRACTLSPATV